VPRRAINLIEAQALYASVIVAVEWRRRPSGKYRYSCRQHKNWKSAASWTRAKYFW
jgi:hypothetical protein